ncbi:MAG: acyl-CoA desaturase [Bacteroidota bacterium]
MSLKNITFSKSHNADFYKTLQSRVRDYFKEKNISRFANTDMVLKTIFMVALYVVPFTLIVTYFENTWMIVLMWVLMGFGMAGVGLSIMHDANHGAYSKNKHVNHVLGLLINLAGGSAINWRIQHNVLHHTYTNISGMDDDINPGKVMRFSPNEERLKMHRFQHVYAWFFYGLMTLMWCTVKDYRQAFKYNKQGLMKTQNTTLGKLLFQVTFGKILYYAVIFTLPLMFSPLSWWATILCFLMMHFIAGLILGMIFQPAHVVPTSNYPVPDDSGVVDADWAVSQLFNTANFAPKARLLSWYVGGLNFQIEHHLFPNICHVHYKKLAKIVRETAEEYNLPYISQTTFADALREHTKMLRDLGTKDFAPAIH